MGIVASIVIPTYNKAALLRATLDALRADAGSRDVELIVVDDGSTDDTASVARAGGVVYAAQVHDGFGLSRARNLGARLATAEQLIFLDDDILVQPGYLAAVLEAQARFGPRAVLAGYTEDYEGPGSPDVRTPFGVWETVGVPTRRFFHVNGGNFALTRSLYWEAGGNDEMLRHGGVEDTVFGYRLSLLPATFAVYHPRMRGRHQPHPKSWNERDQKHNWRMVARRYPVLFVKHCVLNLR